jgi:GNAT superfamily N-acetyltransferase
MRNTFGIALVATVDDRTMTDAWPEVAGARPRLGPPGLSHAIVEYRSGGTSDCLTWRDDEGILRGVLFHYRSDILPYEHRGNVNMWVDPRWHRRGIGTQLLAEADRRWELNFVQQKYTTRGLALVREHLAQAPGWVF